MATGRDIIQARETAAKALADANKKLADDQALIADDMTAVNAAKTADTTAAQSVVKAIQTASPTAGEVLDPAPNADGSYSVYRIDSSDQGYHKFTIQSLDSVIPESVQPDPALNIPNPDATHDANGQSVEPGTGTHDVNGNTVPATIPSV